jgi:L-malate glycosyltransferase
LPHKVVYIIQGLGVGGAGSHLKDLVMGLDRATFEPIIYVLGKPDESSGSATRDLPEVKIVHVEFKIGGAWKGIAGFTSFLGNLKNICRELKKDKPAIVHGHLKPAYLYGILAARLTGVPAVFATRHHRPEAVLKGILQPNPLTVKAESFLANFIDREICVSRAAAEETAKFEKLNPRKITVIHNGYTEVGMPLPEDEKRKYLQLWKRSEDEVLIGITANLHWWKRHEDLVRALPLVKSKTRTPFRLIIVGEDSDGTRLTLESLAKDLGVRDDVVITGPIPDARRLTILFDIFALPSLWENCSIAILEAMTVARPMVVSSCGGNPELVVDGTTGFVIRPNDPTDIAEKISILIDNHELREKMGKAGQARAGELFSVENMVSKTQDLYLEVLSGKGLP